MPRKPVDRPFCGGKWTRARYFGFIRSALRLASRKWPPRVEAKQRVRRRYRGRNKRQKWEYQCHGCGQWYADKEVEVHHLEPCGKLSDFGDLPDFTRRLFCEADGMVVLCHKCHQKEGE